MSWRLPRSRLIRASVGCRCRCRRWWRRWTGDVERARGLFVGELRQVRRYLLDPDLKTKADARVAEMVTENCRILIGHSLGSVVAFEFLRQHPERRLNLLITLGSPLGLRTIRHLMPDPEFGAAEGVPANVGAWVWHVRRRSGCPRPCLYRLPLTPTAELR